VGLWLRNYSGAFAAFASVVLVGVTCVYVHLTSKLTKDTRRQLYEMIKSRLDAQMPYVAIIASGSHVGGTTTVQIETVLENMGTVPARVYVDYPEGWEYAWDFRGETEPGILYLTLNAGDKHVVRFSAEVDPNASVSAASPFRHYQHLYLEFNVSPLVADVEDLFTWSADYDSSTDSLIQDQALAFQDRRIYGELRSFQK